MWLSLFGSLSARVSGVELSLGPPQQRAMLALLLARCGTPVSPDDLVAALWPGGTAPASAAGIVHRYASGLRRALEPGMPARAPSRWIVRSSAGYALIADAESADVARLRALHVPGASLDELLEACALTAEPVDPGLAVRSHPWLQALEAERSAVLIAAADLALPSGQTSRVVPLLRAFAPPDTAITTRLARALEPATRPAQLPADPGVFAGRSRELAQLAAGPAPVTVITGVGGAGKTTLAVRWAHRLASEHPDGQLFVNLNGFDPVRPPVDAATALHGFLEALGVPAPSIPAGLPARTDQFRSLVAGRRMLILIDNARYAADVRLLLPDSAGVTVLVTSRHPLTELAGRRVELGVFDTGEARELLAARIGAARVAAAPDAVDDLVRQCGGLALALAIVAARAAVNPRFDLAALAEEITARRLDGFDVDAPGADLRATFTSSYRMLSPAAARLFRLLPMLPGPDFAAPATVALAGHPAETAAALAELVDAQLVTTPRPGRYGLHDLIREYADELAEPGRVEALRRALDHCLRSAVAGRNLLSPQRAPVPLPALSPGVVPLAFPARADVTAWYADERPVLADAVQVAHRHRLDRHAAALAWASATFHSINGHWHDLLVAHRTGLASALRAGDRWWAAVLHRYLGRALVAFDDFAGAEHHRHEALRLFEELGDRRWTAHSLISIASDRANRSELLSAAELDEVIGLYLRARELYREARELNPGEGGPDEATVLLHVGWLLNHHSDRLPEAVGHLRQSLALLSDTDEVNLRANAGGYLGQSLALLGDYDEAIAVFHAADRDWADLGERFYRAEVQTQLGVCLWKTGSPDAALVAWEHATDLLDGVVLAVADTLRTRLDGFRKDPESATIHPAA
ncbi:tetratricopeptide (TPR) repeat protein/DNA-binding SARP family transcriptional activator [Actinoplanes tereljensis]|uniref:SARP family transcriptional regulator n=1 Tax=Paractinoplanes tereljensis TaxID=571912 RepID=A0A919NXQ4_9ACTN|nr:transcriptional regulator, SARP family protein [Actinoplanes tereljensis]GIF25607.1 SARP family transcriptional regulator [Actinoplanes tereljensis]